MYSSLVGLGALFGFLYLMYEIDHPPKATLINVLHFWDDSATKSHNNGDNKFDVVDEKIETDPLTGLASKVQTHSNGQKTRKAHLQTQ